MGLERILARTGDDVAATRRAKVRAFEAVLALGLVSEPLHAALLRSTRGGFAFGDGLAIGLSAVSALLVIRHRLVGLVGLLLVQLLALASSFPMTANHAFLQIFALAVLVVCDLERPEEQKLALDALRWLFVSLFFFAGLQKLAHGYYFAGEYFAYNLGRESFAVVLGHFMTPAELQRFTVELAGHRAGDGPYRFESALMIALSNGAWIAELAIPVGLLFRRTRTPAVIAAAVFIAVTEAMARELHFGALFVAGLLLFLPSDANRRLLPAFGVFYVWLLSMRLGLLPGVTFY